MSFVNVDPRSEAAHEPVMLGEVLQQLAIRAEGTYIDGTYGRGGHALPVLQRLGTGGRLLVMDRDPAAIAHARRALGSDPRAAVAHGSFGALGEQVERRGWQGTVDGVLLDLGLSTPQLESSGRGFSFRRDEPLDMRFDPGSGRAAQDWLNSAPQQEIERVLREYGEERFARRVAAAVVRERQHAPIADSGRLRELVAGALPSRERDKHPATRTFQALRIQTNDELGELRRALPAATGALRTGGRLVVISFHSLEDRIVKRYLRAESLAPPAPVELPHARAAFRPRLRLVGRALKPGAAEVARNPRARSAVLRVAERLAA
jgi:16S rRNA (cytosine1402-N4)-methyltransferase